MMNAKLLIVDDEHSIRKLLVQILTQAGYECLHAGNVEEAKALLSSSSFDLILSDYKMPGETGLDLLKYAKNHFPHMGRLMLTAYSSPEIAGEIMAVGVYGYIIKPISKNMVLISVENALRHLRLDLHMQACKEELERNLSSRTEKLLAIMNNMSSGLVMFDHEMHIVEINKKMLSWFPEAQEGKNVPCHAALKCSVTCGGKIPEDCPIEKVFAVNAPSESIKSLTTQEGEKDFRIIATPIKSSSGEIIAGIALFEDITEKLLLERDLQQAQKLETVGQLAAGIAHEINSPIQFIGDNLNFLRDSSEDLFTVLDAQADTLKKLLELQHGLPQIADQLAAVIEAAVLDYLREEVPKTIEQSLDGVKRVEKIVRAMKEFSHPRDENKVATNLNKLLESTITVCRNEWKYVADIETHCFEELPPVSCYAGEISQAILNIIVNAAHAIGDKMQPGQTQKGLIRIETGRIKDNTALITISDNGGGIPLEIQKKVFEPFFTTKIRGKGTGQGLAIARRVVTDKHGGNLSFTTEVGKGTTFSLELPIT